MKKIILYLVLCLSITSCVLSGATQSNRTVDNIKFTTSGFAQISVAYPATVMENCMLSYEFLNSSDEQRKAPKFSALSFSPATNTIKFTSGCTIDTKGNDFTLLSMEWSVTYNNYQYTIVCTGEMQWTVTAVHLDKDSLWSGINFCSVFIFTGKDSEDLCTWLCRASGNYKESGNCSATFQSDKDLNVNWIRQSYGSSAITLKQVYSGTFVSTYYIDDKETDWAVLTVENSEIKKIATSLD